MKKSLIKFTTRMRNILIGILILGSLTLQMEMCLSNVNSSYSNNPLLGSIKETIDDSIYHQSSLIEKTVPKDIEKVFLKITALADHDPIFIDNNSAFGPSGYNFPGYGNKSHPYIIDSLNITEIGTTARLINIRNTDVHFEITNCYIKGGTFAGLSFYMAMNGEVRNNNISYNSNGLFIGSSRNINVSDNCIWSNINTGIYQSTVQNVNISDNNISDNGEDGISLLDTSNNTIISRNTIFNCTQKGIRLDWNSSFNDISYNNISQTKQEGIIISESSNNSISHNNVHNASYRGIRIIQSANNTISYNHASNNSYDGISIWESNNNNITHNTIISNSRSGVFINDWSNENIISSNNISQNNWDGIRLDYICEHNLVKNNSVSMNSEYGINLVESDNNNISRNSFNDNYQQSWDDSSGNLFMFNHWSDWIEPDKNNDGIVDDPYLIGGPSGNQDLYPLVFLYEEHDPIFIDGNNDFDNQAITEGWLGNGSSSNPYVVSGYNITSSSTLIEIRNTNVHFQIIDCFLEGQNSAVFLDNVANGIMKSIKILNTTFGFFLDNSINLNISHNTMIKNHEGIYVRDSEYIVIISNTISIMEQYGISLMRSNHTIIEQNIVTYSNYSGISLQNSENNIVRNNTVSQSNLITIVNGGGLYLSRANNNNVSNNNLHNNSRDGICLKYANNNRILNNTSSNNTNNGIFLQYSTNNLISINIFSFNLEYGVFLSVYSVYNNQINWNSFISNDHHANDDGSSNEFLHNFWDDWISPDNNGDGIVDVPYSIEGSSDNQDSYPLADLVELPIHLISTNVIYPNGGEILLGINIIQWAVFVGSFDHNISYSVLHSADNGFTWNLLVSNLIETNYSLDTTLLPDGSFNLIKVIANCSEGLSTNDTSNSVFIIDNNAPIIDLEEIINDTILFSTSIVNLNITDNLLSTVWYNWDGAANQLLISPYDVSVPSNEGYHWLTVYANDSVGHVTIQKYRWSIITPSTSTSTSTTTNPVITSGFELFPFMMGLIVIFGLIKKEKEKK